MKKGFKKYTVTTENFSKLQGLRNCIKDYFEVQNVKWAGNWTGMNYTSLSFYSTENTAKLIEKFLATEI